MKIWMKHYQKRDGNFIIYYNNDRKVNIASDEQGSLPAAYGARKWTKGQHALVEGVHAALENLDSREALGKVEYKDELPLGGMDSEGSLFVPIFKKGWLYAATDTADVGGVKVGSDGGYLVSPAGYVFPAKLKI